MCGHRPRGSRALLGKRLFGPRERYRALNCAWAWATERRRRGREEAWMVRCDSISFIFGPQWFRIVTGSHLVAHIYLFNEWINDLINLNILCWCLDCVPVPQKAVLSERFLPEHIRLFHECVCRHISNLSFWTGTIPCSRPPSKNQSLWSVLCNQIESSAFSLFWMKFLAQSSPWKVRWVINSRITDYGYDWIPTPGSAATEWWVCW